MPDMASPSSPLPVSDSNQPANPAATTTDTTDTALQDFFADLAVDPDAYAETAENDDADVDPALRDPTLARTYQSEEAFAAQRDGYVARVDDGGHWEVLGRRVSELQRRPDQRQGQIDGEAGTVVLSKPDRQLLAAVAAELYFEKDWEGLVELCGMVRGVCSGDKKSLEGLDTWEEKARGKLKSGESTGKGAKEVSSTAATTQS